MHSFTQPVVDIKEYRYAYTRMYTHKQVCVNTCIQSYTCKLTHVNCMYIHTRIYVAMCNIIYVYLCIHVRARVCRMCRCNSKVQMVLRVHVYACICICVCVCVCVYMCVLVCMYVRTYVRTYVCMYVYVRMCTCPCIEIYAYMYICTYVYQYVCIYAYMCNICVHV